MTSLSMPSPSRIANSSIRLLVRNGVDEQEAITIITGICDRIIEAIGNDYSVDVSWLRAISVYAQVRNPGFRSNLTDSIEQLYGQEENQT